jgi:hypothetical protein
LTSLSPKVKESNKLYYNRYQYCGSAYLPYASTLRKNSHYHLDSTLDLRATLRHNDSIRSLAASTWFRNPPIDLRVRQDLHEFLDLVQNAHGDFKIVYQSHSFSVYANELGTVSQFLLEELADAQLTMRRVTHAPNTIVRRSTDYQYRCYLKNMSISAGVKENMTKFFASHPEIKLGPSFKHWLEHGYKYCNSHYFFDYNDEGIKLLFELAAPGLVREAYTIITRNDNG